MYIVMEDCMVAHENAFVNVTFDVHFACYFCFLFLMIFNESESMTCFLVQKVNSFDNKYELVMESN